MTGFVNFVAIKTKKKHGILGKKLYSLQWRTQNSLYVKYLCAVSIGLSSND